MAPREVLIKSIDHYDNNNKTVVKTPPSNFGWVRILPFTVEHAYVAGEIEAELRADPDVQQDRINSLMGDLLIAGVARSIDAPVVTRNVEDFERFDGVSVEEY